MTWDVSIHLFQNTNTYGQKMRIIFLNKHRKLIHKNITAKITPTTLEDYMSNDKISHKNISFNYCIAILSIYNLIQAILY